MTIYRLHAIFDKHQIDPVAIVEDVRTLRLPHQIDIRTGDDLYATIEFSWNVESEQAYDHVRDMEDKVKALLRKWEAEYNDPNATFDALLGASDDSNDAWIIHGFLKWEVIASKLTPEPVEEAKPAAGRSTIVEQLKVRAALIASQPE